LHFNPPRRRRELGQRDREHAVAKVRGNAVLIDGVDELEGPLERPVAALDLVVAVGRRPGAAPGRTP
jgi:hypothetical protein